MRFQRWQRVACAAAAAGLWAGCAREPGAAAGAGTARRVVCASPAVTELVFAMGCGDRVVGVSDYTTHPPEACALPTVGGRLNMNRERLLVLHPDLIVAQGQHAEMEAFAAANQMRLLSVRLDSMGDLFDAIGRMGKALGAETAARDVAGRLRAELDAVSRSAHTAGGAVPVLLLIGRTPGDLSGMTTVGRGTFVSQLLSLAGGSNIFSDATGLYPQVSAESVLMRRPEVIIEINLGRTTEAERQRAAADWQRLPTLPAVASGRIHCLTNDVLLVPGPRMGEAARVLAEVIRQRQP